LVAPLPTTYLLKHGVCKDHLNGRKSEWQKKEKGKRKKITDCVVFGYKFVVNLKFKLNVQTVNDYA
jgi:hypothetical protein